MKLRFRAGLNRLQSWDPWLVGAWGLSILTAVFLVWGHLGVGSGHLDPFTKHISQYASSAPNGWAVAVAMITFSLLNALTGIRLILSPWIRRRLIGAVVLSVAGMIIFVAVFKTFVVGKPGSAAKSWWDKVWDATFGGAVQLPNPVSTAEAGIHNLLIGIPAIVILGALALVILMLGCNQDRRWMKRGLVYWGLSFFGLVGSNFNLLGLDGGLQRLGFANWIVCTLIVLHRIHLVETGQAGDPSKGLRLASP